ncbi:unnamed protein product [Gulo gulo]|uniref:Uncharacterized protein n=1 Tax=Gulo gulo TaxID=48420 RepID=A0A9X9MDN2_GULGU|nr:unnamed protein product [Gulo gulo]
MLAKLAIFMVDLTLALATFGLLYAVSLIATTAIFIFILFYLFKGMDKHCDFSKGRVREQDLSGATGKAFAGNMGRVSSGMLPVHFPAAREEAQGVWFCLPESEEPSVVEEGCRRTCQNVTPTQLTGIFLKDILSPKLDQLLVPLILGSSLQSGIFY